ncbi:hypothetical protein AB1E18_010376 [Capra hircus]
MCQARTRPSGLSPRAGGRGQLPKAESDQADLQTAAARKARPSPAKLRASAREVSFTNLSPGLRHPRVASQSPGDAICTREARKFRDERAYQRASSGPRFRPRTKSRPQSVFTSQSLGSGETEVSPAHRARSQGAVRSHSSVCIEYKPRPFRPRWFPPTRRRTAHRAVSAAELPPLKAVQPLPQRDVLPTV